MIIVISVSGAQRRAWRTASAQVALHIICKDHELCFCVKWATMKTFIFLLLLAFAVTKNVYAQNDDGLQIPVEEDNQFPPDANTDLNNNVIEGSGAGTIEDPNDNAQVTSAPLEDIESRLSVDDSTTTATTLENTIPCPTECVCNTEESDFVVDCSGYGLTQFPSPIDSQTTILKLQNNKLTEIPKEISALTNLKVLNAENNDIMEIVPGSISELPNLTILNLENNRLLEYPTDLKNGFGLTKLQEIDLGGNDMRSTLSSELFSTFKSLNKLTLPSSNEDQINELCTSLGGTLKTVCTGSCTNSSYDCPDAHQSIEDGLFDATLPFSIAIDNNNDPIALEPSDDEINHTTAAQNNDQLETTTLKATVVGSETTVTDDVSEPSIITARSGFNKEPTANAGIAPLSAIVTAPKQESEDDDSAVKVGATTTDSKKGGIDKSVIGIIIAGMILVVAGITLKKNWSSITKRFSSTPRTANERTGGTANGTAPEEMPLQDKSPV